MKVLVVGAGSIGQVFGRHLQIGGCEVSFYVRGERVEDLQSGLVLYALNQRRAREHPIPFKGFEVISEATKLTEREWDQVYLCVPSDALRTGLLEEIGPAFGGAILVTIQPGLDDTSFILKHANEANVVSGVISFISYQAPLEGEIIPQAGTAYWFPPLVATPFSGSPERARGVVTALRRGGFPARVHPDILPSKGFSVALLNPVTTGLQITGWSVEGFIRSPLYEVALRAIREGTAVVAEIYQTKPPLFSRALEGTMVSLALHLAPRLVPFNMESFLAKHYTKHTKQTRVLMAGYIEKGEELGLETAAMEELLEALG